jgi:hypothetical protein
MSQTTILRSSGRLFARFERLVELLVVLDEEDHRARVLRQVLHLAAESVG